MKNLLRTLVLVPLLILSMGAHARGNYAETIAIFKNAGASGRGAGRTRVASAQCTLGISLV